MNARIVAVFGNLVIAETNGRVVQNSLAYCLRSDGVRLMSEVIRVRGRLADLQVFEETRGLRVGDAVELRDEMLSVVLGPGLLGRIYDGLQNPLPELAEQVGYFLQPGACTSMAFLWNSRGISLRWSNPVPWSAPEIRWGRSRKASSHTRSWFPWPGAVSIRSTRSPLPNRTPSRSKSRCWPGAMDSSTR